MVLEIEKNYILYSFKSTRKCSIYYQNRKLRKWIKSCVQLQNQPYHGHPRNVNEDWLTF